MHLHMHNRDRERGIQCRRQRWCRCNPKATLGTQTLHNKDRQRERDTVSATKMVPLPSKTTSPGKCSLALSGVCGMCVCARAFVSVSVSVSACLCACAPVRLCVCEGLSLAVAHTRAISLSHTNLEPAYFFKSFVNARARARAPGYNTISTSRYDLVFLSSFLYILFFFPYLFYFFISLPPSLSHLEPTPSA
jgi:hypothetical protein